MYSSYPKLQVHDVHTQFGSSVVHSGVSFEVNTPSVIALIGASGSGKSVLLREILGLHSPTSGTVQLFGHNLSKLSLRRSTALRTRFGVLFQEAALFSGLNVGENVAVPFVEHTKIKPAVIRELVELRLSLCGLDSSVVHKMPSELSGGMKKRVALARALALEPELLFLDEPTSGLDPINARAFDSLIRTLVDGMGLTVFLVTHDLDTLAGICDRIIALADGRVIADGPLAQVKKVDHPWIQTYFSPRSSE